MKTDPDRRLRIVRVHSRGQVTQVRRLFKEYAAELGVSLCFQNFSDELARLPGDYVPPKGSIFLAEFNGKLAGCVALRNLGRGVCEMKRLYVRPRFRSRHMGRVLAETIIREAVRLGYRSMRLDTLAKLRPALALYESLGFKKTKPYYANPLEAVVFMRLKLNSASIWQLAA